MRKLCFKVAAVCLAATLVLGVLPPGTAYAEVTGLGSVTETEVTGAPEDPDPAEELEEPQNENDTGNDTNTDTGNDTNTDTGNDTNTNTDTGADPDPDPDADANLVDKEEGTPEAAREEDDTNQASGSSNGENKDPAAGDANTDPDNNADDKTDADPDPDSDAVAEEEGVPVAIDDDPDDEGDADETVTTTASVTLTNIELDNTTSDSFTYSFYVWTYGDDGSIQAVTGNYGDLSLGATTLTYVQAANNGLPYVTYYNSFGVGQVRLSAGQTITISGLPEGCSYRILTGASQYYYVKSVTATYGTVNELMGTVYVEGATGNNAITCTNVYAPNSLRLGETVISADADAGEDTFDFVIYLYSYSSSGNTPLFDGESVDVSITAEGIGGVEAPVLGDTLNFTTVTTTLPGFSKSGTYNMAKVTLKDGQAIVIHGLGTDYGAYIYQEQHVNYKLYSLEARYVHQTGWGNFQGSYDNRYQYINECNVSSSVGFTNAQVNLTISKEVEGIDTDREFVFNMYLTEYDIDLGRYVPFRTDAYDLTYTDPTGDEPETVEFKTGTDYGMTTTLTTTSGTAYDVEWSVAQIKVKPGQSVTIEDLPAGITYLIQEVPVNNYTLTDATTNSAYAVVNDNYSVYEWLCAADATTAFTNTYTPPEDGVDLTVSKTVTGDFIDRDREFSFTIALTDADGNPLSDMDIEVLLPGEDTAVVRSTDANGEITVTLKDGEEITLQDLPKGTQYVIAETDATYYTTTFDVTGGSTSTEEQPDQTQSGTMDSADGVSVSVTNNLTVAVPSGVETEIQPAIVMGGIALGLVALLGITQVRRKKRAEK